ncbi:MAG: hypothetical protein JWO92_2301 [Chitinophagaceae bacterium]|nr:hypothetical protein [Chitinophagaceae bacterium]MDB5224315.1 hypothetical protein [Chitinophagaceae bacterium]
MKGIALILFSLLFISIAFAQNEGRINLTKGQKFSVDNKVTAVTTQTLMGQSMESNAELTAKYSIEVKAIKGYNYNLTNTFAKLKAKVSAMGNDVNFDSDKKEDMAGEYAASLKDIINVPKEVVIDKSGKILNSKKEETTTTGVQPDIMKMMMEQLLGNPEETGYGANLAFVSTPSKISAGYNWTDSSSKDGIENITTYTVKEIKGNNALIIITGILNTDVKSQMQGMNIVNKSKGNLKGEEILDITTGIIKEKNTTLESSGTVSIEAQGLEIPMTTKVMFSSSVKPA